MWSKQMEKLNSEYYMSMADAVDLSSIPSGESNTFIYFTFLSTFLKLKLLLPNFFVCTRSCSYHRFPVICGPPLWPKCVQINLKLLLVWTPYWGVVPATRSSRFWCTRRGEGKEMLQNVGSWPGGRVQWRFWKICTSFPRRLQDFSFLLFKVSFISFSSIFFTVSLPIFFCISPNLPTIFPQFLQLSSSLSPNPDNFPSLSSHFNPISPHYFPSFPPISPPSPCLPLPLPLIFSISPLCFPQFPPLPPP